ncbi:addiction module antidote protein [Massilia sp. W12]|uniref:helix-turn-helix domain-containing transcriptional regulator n=1 Tax=Massilia sp. W12 TaxID=3126507 RepID=UPI0030D3DDC4
MKDRSHDEAIAELFKDDPEFAVQYLNQLLQDGESEDLMIALQQVALTCADARPVAENANATQSQIPRTMTAQSNAELHSLLAALKGLGLRLSVQLVSGSPAERAA